CRGSYGHGEGPLSLLLRYLPGAGATTADRPAPGAVLPRAFLLSRVEADGRLTALYTFEARNWPQPSLPLRLPVGACLVAARVDGREANVEAVSREENAGPIVELPVPHLRPITAGSPAIHHFQVLYVIEQPPNRLLSLLESPAPLAPLRPLVFHRVWRLPASLAPLSESGLLRLPGGATPAAFPATAKVLDHLPGWSSLLPRALALDRWAQHQEQAVRLAGSRLRRAAAGAKQMQGEDLRDITPDLSQQGLALVVDGLALEAAGLAPGRSFTIPPDSGAEEEAGTPLGSLASLNLVLVSCKSAPLVTTRSQQQALLSRVSRTDNGEVPDDVFRAVSTAQEHEEDASGRFRTVAAWLRRPGTRPTEGEVLGPGLEVLPSDEDRDGWIDWVVTAGPGDRANLWVIRSAAPGVAGLTVALLFLLTACSFPRRARARLAADPTSGAPQPLAFLFLWLGISGIGVLWLPVGLRDLAWWPLAAGILVALWWYLLPLSRLASGSRRPSAVSEGSRTPLNSAGNGLSPGVTTAGVL